MAASFSERRSGLAGNRGAGRPFAFRDRRSISPRARAGGANVWARQRDWGFELHQVIGLRDLWLGALAVILAAMKEWRALAVWFGLGTLVCFSDAGIAASSSGRTGPMVFHVACGVACAVLACFSPDQPGRPRALNLPLANGLATAAKPWQNRDVGRPGARRIWFGWGPPMVMDNLFLLAVAAFGLGLSLATYRLFARSNGWPMGALQADLPIIPITIGLLGLLAGLAFATARGADDGGWTIIAIGFLLAVLWTGILRVGSQMSLFLAPIATFLLLLGWLSAPLGYSERKWANESPTETLQRRAYFAPQTRLSLQASRRTPRRPRLLPPRPDQFVTKRADRRSSRPNVERCGGVHDLLWRGDPRTGPDHRRSVNVPRRARQVSARVRFLRRRSRDANVRRPPCRDLGAADGRSPSSSRAASRIRLYG